MYNHRGQLSRSVAYAPMRVHFVTVCMQTWLAAYEFAYTLYFVSHDITAVNDIVTAIYLIFVNWSCILCYVIYCYTLYRLRLFNRDCQPYTDDSYGALAQLVEHPTLNRQVVGSTPTCPIVAKTRTAYAVRVFSFHDDDFYYMCK